MHNADNPYKNEIDKFGIPAEVDEYETLNWFKVFWEGGDFPGSSPENSCAANQCKTQSDGSCVCRTSVSESAAFNDGDYFEKAEVMDKLFLGAIGPEPNSVPVPYENGLTVHKVNGLIDTSTVFEVQDKGRTFFLKNLESKVTLSGWSFAPIILEAENAMIRLNATIKDSSSLSASNGQYIDFDSTDEAFAEWGVNIGVAGEYIVSFRYALDTYTR